MLKIKKPAESAESKEFIRGVWIDTLDRLWRAARFTSSYADPITSESEEENFEEGLDFEDGEETIASIRRRLSNEAEVSRVGETLNQTLGADRDEGAAPREHFSPVQVRFPVNAAALRPPVTSTVEESITMVNFDAENAEDSASAMDNLRSVHCPFNKSDIQGLFESKDGLFSILIYFLVLSNPYLFKIPFFC